MLDLAFGLHSSVDVLPMLVSMRSVYVGKLVGQKGSTFHGWILIKFDCFRLDLKYVWVLFQNKCPILL